VPVTLLLVANEPRTDCDPVVHRGAHRLEHLDREPQPLVERAAVLVSPPVVRRRQEFVDEVSVRGVHLDPVEPRIGRVPGTPREVLDHLVNLVRIDRLGGLHVVRDARRRPHGQPRPRRVIDAAVVGQLQEGQRAVFLNLLAHAP
jgi:hypothetical protein